jgi:formiminotetrahydrofolate cyclodeaminase
MMNDTPTISQYLDSLAAGTAAPGGGSAAALSGAMAAALVEMACNLTAGRAGFTAGEAEVRQARVQASHLRLTLSRLVEADARAFDAVMATYDLPKQSPPEKEARRAAIRAALLEAAQVQMQVVNATGAIIRRAGEIVALLNPHTLGDIATAVRLAEAGRQAAALNVRLNLQLVGITPSPHPLQAELEITLVDLDDVPQKIVAGIIHRTVK